MRAVARRRFGEAMAPAVVEAWRAFSAAFREFPFDGSVVYNAPDAMRSEQPALGRADAVSRDDGRLSLR